MEKGHLKAKNLKAKPFWNLVCISPSSVQLMLILSKTLHFDQCEGRATLLNLYIKSFLPYLSAFEASVTQLDMVFCESLLIYFRRVLLSQYLQVFLWMSDF